MSRKVLFILNDPPYGAERVFNVRLGNAVAKRDDTEVRIFLMGDAPSYSNHWRGAASGSRPARSTGWLWSDPNG